MNPEPPLLTPPARHRLPWAVSLAMGATGWIAVALLTHRKEAWDSPVYFQIAYPLFGLVVALLGHRWPARAWRWPLGIALGQASVAFCQNPTGNLLPLGLVAFALMSVPLVLPAMLGARLRRWRDGPRA